jgi:hypothetical protein
MPAAQTADIHKWGRFPTDSVPLSTSWSQERAVTGGPGGPGPMPERGQSA